MKMKTDTPQPDPWLTIAQTLWREANKAQRYQFLAWIENEYADDEPVVCCMVCAGVATISEWGIDLCLDRSTDRPDLMQLIYDRRRAESDDQDRKDAGGSGGQ